MSQPKTYDYRDRDLQAAMLAKGQVQEKRIERKAKESSHHNPCANRTTVADIVPSYRNTQFAHVGID